PPPLLPPAPPPAPPAPPVPPPGTVEPVPPPLTLLARPGSSPAGPACLPAFTDVFADDESVALRTPAPITSASRMTTKARPRARCATGPVRNSRQKRRRRTGNGASPMGLTACLPTSWRVRRGRRGRAGTGQCLLRGA